MVKALGKKQEVNGWVILAIGIVLGILGYFFYLETYASGFTTTSKLCQAAGGSKSGKLCVGGGLDGARIRN